MINSVLKTGLIGWWGLWLNFSFATQAMAESIASYPAGWEDWPAVKQAIIYPAVSELPASSSVFSQATAQFYSWINNSQGSSVTIYIHPEKLKQYMQRGPYSDGPTMVAFAEEASLILVTEHIGGEAIFGSYNLKGEDISYIHPSLKPEACEMCHSTYQEYCRHGVCSEFDEQRESLK